MAAKKQRRSKHKKDQAPAQEIQQGQEKPSKIYEIKPRPAEERKELSPEEEKVVLEVPERGNIRRYEFASEEEKQIWAKMMKKRKLHTPYFLLGIGINLLLYYAGLDLSRNMLWGFLIGIGIPITTMLGLAELHYRYLILPRENNG